MASWRLFDFSKPIIIAWEQPARRRGRTTRLDSLPEMILPALAWAASGKTYIPRVAVKTLVTYCGPLFLERCLGGKRSRELLARYPKRAALLGVYRCERRENSIE